MITGIVCCFFLLFIVYLFKMHNDAVKLKNKKRIDRKNKINRKLAYFERIIQTSSLPRSMGLELTFTKASKYYLNLIANDNWPDTGKRLCKCDEKINALHLEKRTNSEPVTTPTSDLEAGIFNQSLFLYHQALKSEIKTGSIQMKEGLHILYTVEDLMVKCKVEESLSKGRQALEKNILGTARSRFEHVINVINSTGRSDEPALNHYFVLAKDGLGKVLDIINGKSPHANEITSTQRTIAPNKDKDDGLERMMGDKKEKWA
jgi:hypothetical protein